ncbi:MAG: Sua5/YciO/YrdC/YwlC family protein, partial [Mariprofundaceae bacterium]|nr:Sua5/YciO/YrdC/YwlC family protein [Mariprofundaceae bacterium]
RQKLRLLHIAEILRGGGLLAHDTATLPGIAAVPKHSAAVARLCRFKQRSGPFVLLADSMHSALRPLIHLPCSLRKAMQQTWPGPTTFIINSRTDGFPGIAGACFSGRSLALRVDADPACRYLARLCGGLLISSSLNRRNQAVQAPNRTLRIRWHRHFDAQFATRAGSGRASRLLKLKGSALLELRS